MSNTLIDMFFPADFMFRDMAPELELFRKKDYPTLSPTMFFSDIPSCFHIAELLRKSVPESGWLSMNPPVYVHENRVEYSTI